MDRSYHDVITRRDLLRALSGGALVLASGSILAGCGGAGSGSGPAAKAGAAASGTTAATGSARATVHITWPKPTTAGSARSRLIPAASTAVKIAITNGATPVVSHVISAPDTSYSFGALPVGSLTVTASAYPDASASGVAQAVGTGTLVTQAGQTAALTVTMDSTVDHLAITPTSASVSVGTTKTLNVTAYDTASEAADHIVLVSPSNLQWRSDNPTIAKVDKTTGVVTGVAVGSVQITVTEKESGKASLPVTMTVSQENADLLGYWKGTFNGELNNLLAFNIYYDDKHNLKANVDQYLASFTVDVSRNGSAVTLTGSTGLCSSGGVIYPENERISGTLDGATISGTVKGENPCSTGPGSPFTVMKQ